MQSTLPSLIAQDTRFEAFRAKDFDAAQFTSHALSGALSSAQTTSHQLREDIKRLDDVIHHEVVQKQQKLGDVVDGMTDMVSSCTTVQTTIDRLKTSVEDMHTSLASPCNRLQQQTSQLKNLRSTIDTLRAISRQLKLVEKLKKRMGDTDTDLNTVDVPDIALIMAEFNNSGREIDVTGIHILEEDTKYVDSLMGRVRHWAETKLMKGQETMNQAEMGVALHVYFNLNDLQSAVETVMSKRSARFSHCARNAFDFHKLVNSGKTTANYSLQDSVWSSMQSLMSNMEEDLIGIHHLVRVLKMKHDPVTHTSFLSVVDSGEALVDRFLNQSAVMLERILTNAVQPGKSTPVREVLVQGFPKLAVIVEACIERLSQRMTNHGRMPELISQYLQTLLNSCHAVQTVFTTRSITHMMDAVNVVFPVGSRSVPASTEIQKLVSVFHEEMKQAENSLHCCRLVANNIANAVLSIAEKVRLLAAPGSDLRSTTAGCNTAQLRNITLCSSLQEIHKSLVALITKLDQRGIEFLIPSCDMLRSTAIDLIAPIFKSFSEHVEQTLLGLHRLVSWKDESSTTLSDANRPSEFVNTVRTQLRTFSIEFLARFAPPFSPSTPSFARSLVKRLCCRTIVFFIRHAAMIRPLSAKGRRQLIRDSMEMEQVISQTLLPVSSLESQAVSLHAFQELLTTKPENIQTNATVMQLPRTVILHHLFTYAPKEVVSPHKHVDLTPAQYSFWLDSHSVEEAIGSVRSILSSLSLKQDADETRSILAILWDLSSM